MSDPYRNCSRRLSPAILLATVIVLLFGGIRSAIPGETNHLVRGFSHGVNLSHWFAQSLDGYDPARLASFVTDADLRAIKAVGLDHVRLSVAPSILFKGGKTQDLDASKFSSLTKALDRIQVEGLNVALDFHPVGDEKDALLTESGQNAFIAEWEALSRQLVSRNPNSLAFEILNEPDPLKGDEWWGLQGRVLAGIRRIDKRRIVIVNGGGWSGIDDLVVHQPYDDPRLLYTVHYYAPLLFTHQGANWSWNIAERVAALAWPQAREQAVKSASAATLDKEAEGFVRDQISSGEFTFQWMDQQFDTLAQWQIRYNSPAVYIGEFGVYAKSAPKEARLSWIAAVREGCEKRGWGWSLWDNSASFGFSDVRNGKQVIDPGMLRALGTVP